MAVRNARSHRAFRHREKLLFCCVLLLGVLLVLLIPPFDSPDELAHFQNVWAIGHGRFLTRAYWAEGKLLLPSGFTPLMREYPVRLIGIANTNKCSWGDLFAQSFAYVPSGELSAVHGRIFSFGYLFSALGMALGSAAGALLGIPWLDSPYIQLLLGRLCNWVFFALVMRAACRRQQPFRRTLFVLASMPMCLFLGATLNYDAVLIPLSLYMFAEILSLSGGRVEPLSAREYGRLLLCALFICGTKAPYACLMLLFLLLPRNLFGPVRPALRRGMIVLAAAAGFVLSVLPYLVPKGGAVGYASAQVDWLLAHPLSLPGIIVKTLWTDAPSIVIGFWGCFGWLDVHLPRILLLAGWLVLLASAVLECGSVPFSVPKRNRFPGLAAAVLVYCVLCTLQYVSHAPKVNGNVIGGDRSYGFQGRYLIPCFLPFLFTFAGSWLGTKKPGLVPVLKRRFAAVQAVWAVCCCLVTVVTLLTRYWL